MRLFQYLLRHGNVATAVFPRRCGSSSSVVVSAMSRAAGVQRRRLMGAAAACSTLSPQPFGVCSFARSKSSSAAEGSSGMAVCATTVAKEKYERLPDFARPTHYNIELAPNLESFDFNGRVDINVDIVKPTSILKLHANALNILKVAAKQENGEVLKDLAHTYSEKANMLEVKLPSQLGPQKVVLSIDFIGTHNDKMHGFYRSKYTTDKGEEKWMVTTQFESTYARLAFPCWDEPIFKATFDVTLVVDSKFQALSNNEATSDVVDEKTKKRTVKFATTPKMSAYLVAFAVGEFEYIEDKCKSGTLVRIYTVPGKKEMGRFGLEVSVKAIDWYNQWFGIDYPLPKCDLIAIPDFSMGAMENWGLVTFREIALLFDPEKTSTKQKSYVALVIAHELAHMWFGDLVTMKWWTDLWLKEGFASFMEYMFVGYNYPEMKIWLHFLNDELGSGFNLDSLRSSHPIEVEIDNPNELDEIYDSITYAKSNSINRMLCFYLGEETFQKGLRGYLQKYKYDNAQTADLWAALTEASGEDVSSLMSGWTKQMGFPVVNVSLVKQEGTKRTYKFTQQRFLADGSEDENKTKWQVPITIATSSDPEKVMHRFVMKGESEEVTLDVKEGDWVKVNSGTTGFYRVGYSDEMFQQLLSAVTNNTLPVLDRFGLANDLFALVSAGKAPVTQFLDLLEASKGEKEYSVWRTLDLGLGSIAQVLNFADKDGTLKKRFDHYVCEVLSGVGTRLGWSGSDGEDSQVSLLRGLIQGRLCKSGHQPSIDKAIELFHAYIEENKPLHADLRLSIFGAAVRSGGDKEFDSLRRHFETCGFPEIERHALVALGQADPAKLPKLFEFAVNEGKVRSQDLYQIFVGPSLSRPGQEFAWTFFRNNLDTLITKFGNVNSSLFQHCFKLSAQDAASEEMAQEVEAFFCGKLDPTSLATLNRPIRQVAEHIRNNIKLLEAVQIPVEKYLKDRSFYTY